MTTTWHDQQGYGPYKQQNVKAIRLIERLEKEVLVVRKNDPSDKRVFRVYLTNRASALIQAFLPVHNNYMVKVMSVLDSHEKEQLILLLRKLNKGLDSI